ncbi:P-loop NTPase [Candidatus Soleaferrea massiliensis]|uniref:nucleotide-binding protein n=1 Tax=Candidatus Soleaferrea massiliensis TaxID=1470354 RepID=UPI00058C50F1|nr:P-loop NTPase [Candidatus Soleaferrea massiliensis]
MINLLNKLTIITGHYGSGKTNIAVNLALDLKKMGKEVILVDLDIVNPYFRSADFTEELEAKGIEVSAPVYANTNLDIPALTAAIGQAIVQREKYVIVDVGGDDAGAAALGRYSEDIMARDYNMFYVINRYRYLTRDAEEAAEILSEIELMGKVKATGILNNSNLSYETSVEDILSCAAYAEEVSQETGLPIAAHVIRKDLLAQCPLERTYGVDIFVKPVWEKKQDSQDS